MSSPLNYSYRRIQFTFPIGTTTVTLYRGNFNYLYREDENTTDVQVQLNSQSESSIQFKSQTQIEIGSGGADELIVTCTATAQFDFIVIIGDSEQGDNESGVKIRRDSTQTTVSGIVDVDLTEIAGSTNTVGGYFPITNSTGSTAGSLNLSSDTTSDTTIFTVPASFVFLITSVFIATDDSSSNVFCQIKHQFSGGTGDTTLVGLVANSNSASMNCLSRSFPIPFVASAGDLIIISDGGGSARPSGAVAGTLVAV